MVRRYGEFVEVRTVPDGPGGGGSPSSFLWRGRVYAVRAVDAHWQERRPWWKDARTVSPGVGENSAGVCAPEGAQSSGLFRRAAGREVWRVHAQAGRSGSSGVFELGTDAPDGSGAWILLRAHD